MLIRQFTFPYLTTLNHDEQQTIQIHWHYTLRRQLSVLISDSSNIHFSFFIIIIRLCLWSWLRFRGSCPSLNGNQREWVRSNNTTSNKHSRVYDVERCCKLVLSVQPTIHQSISYSLCWCTQQQHLSSSFSASKTFCTIFYVVQTTQHSRRSLYSFAVGHGF